MTFEHDASEAVLVREIMSWLEDEQMLGELGRRCVSLLVDHPRQTTSPLGPAAITALRQTLAGDWLAHHEEAPRCEHPACRFASGRHGSGGAHKLAAVVLDPLVAPTVDGDPLDEGGELMDEDFSGEEKARMIEHMNDDHLDACLLYARHYLGVTDARSASMADITRAAMTLDIELDDGSSQTGTFSFERPLTSVEDAALHLAKLVERLGEG